jgi:hypothetical protein
MRRTLILICLASPAAASCPDLAVLTCTTAGGAKVLEVCLAGEALTYSFGKAGKSPDITLTEPLANGTYTPWNGIGRAIWESTTFTNDGFVYEAWSSFDRLDENAVLEGGVNVLKGDRLQAEVRCDAGSVTAGFDQLFPVMQTKGFCWNRDSFVWGRVCPAD